jgi:OOP family OmpA-OmpF porin
MARPVRITGEVGNEALRQQVASDLSLASNTSYTVTNALKVGSQQNVLDQTLANRIIEFQSGSARLTPFGMSILDEMVAKMAQMPDSRFLIIGHTDNVGQRESNLTLSHARALAVKNYMMAKGIPGSHMDVLGKGRTSRWPTTPATMGAHATVVSSSRSSNGSPREQGRPAPR